MVSPVAKLFRAALASFLLLPGLAAAQSIPAHQIGDTAAQDFIAPFAFTVIDLDATENLRRQLAAIAPTYFRHDSKTAAEVEAAFRKNFAVDPALPSLWAQAEPGDANADKLAAKLREAAARRICATNLPPELRTSPQVRLLTDAAPTLAEAERDAVEIPRDQLVPLDRARADLLATFSAAQQPVAKFLASFLKTNCAPDIELSRQSRIAQAETAISAVQYVTGQLIVRRGEIIAAKTKSALDKAGKLLAARTAAAREQEAQQLAARKIAAGKIAAAQSAAQPNPWPWIVVLISAALACIVVWNLARRRRRGLRRMKFADSGELEVVSHADSDWQRRALAAEQRAERATAIVRKGLVGQLARLLTNDLMKKLVSQRTELIAGQHQAVGEIELLAARLEKLEGAPPQGYYEQRIAELEKELATKNAENRELLRARIEIARRQQAESQRRVDWN